ncbi:dethiobiotin synthase [Thermosulfuriphilus sp.]
MIVFVIGTDTGIGKTMATGIMARALLKAKLRVITQKPVQTGADTPEDILAHRKLMGIPPDPPSLARLTCPYIFPYPAAPEMAARLVGEKVDLGHLRQTAGELTRKYDFLLIEGAGGLLVPLTPEATIADLISELKAPVVVVSAAKLGTINHTLLTLEALHHRGIAVLGLVYNLFFSEDDLLAEESLRAISRLGKVKNILILPRLKGLPPEDNLLEEVRRFLLRP